MIGYILTCCFRTTSFPIRPKLAKAHRAGILDIFDRYNFTVKEDEPLEKDVAVDPEMLGKVFENLLEVKDRKSKAHVLHSREIVHYICQQSLIQYLDTTLNPIPPAYQDLDSNQTGLFGNTGRSGQLKLEVRHDNMTVPREDLEVSGAFWRKCQRE